MKIKFSRHSKRRLKLYSIKEEEVISKINIFLSQSKFNDDKLEIIEKLKLSDKYPIKIVFEKFKQEVIVITVYPLKKGKK